MLKEFKEFALKGNLVDIAVGFVMGAAFKSVVTSFTGGIVSPSSQLEKTVSCAATHCWTPGWSAPNSVMRASRVAAAFRKVLAENPRMLDAWEMLGLTLLRLDRTAIETDHCAAGALPIVALIAFLMAIFVVIVGFFWLPLKRMWKARNQSAETSEDNEQNEAPPLEQDLGAEQEKN